jgi:hypothetical protein
VLIGTRLIVEASSRGLPCVLSPRSPRCRGSPGATEGFNRLTFGLLRVAHFDPPPPRRAGRPRRARWGRPAPHSSTGSRPGSRWRTDAWWTPARPVAAAAARLGWATARQHRLCLRPHAGPAAWSRNRPDLGALVQIAGGVVGFPTPRRVRHLPYVQIRPSIPWTTLALTIHADGTIEPRLVGASSFPRHWVYDHTGRLVAKSGFIDYDAW